jgi:hypothetical protein
VSAGSGRGRRRARPARNRRTRCAVPRTAPMANGGPTGTPRLSYWNVSYPRVRGCPVMRPSREVVSGRNCLALLAASAGIAENAVSITAAAAAAAGPRAAGGGPRQRPAVAMRVDLRLPVRPPRQMAARPCRRARAASRRAPIDNGYRRARFGKDHAARSCAAPARRELNHVLPFRMGGTDAEYDRIAYRHFAMP